MSLGSFLKKITGAVQAGVPIVVDASIGASTSKVLLRQVLIAGGTALATKGVITGDQVEPLVGASVTLLTAAFGIVKHINDKQAAVIVANAAPDTVAVVK